LRHFFFFSLRLPFIVFLPSFYACHGKAIPTSSIM